MGKNQKVNIRENTFVYRKFICTFAVIYTYIYVYCFEILDHKSVVVIEEHARTHERVDLVAERLQIFKNDVLRPKGAVVSLSLGLIATAITVALIVCRLRVIKRRGRCGHGPYAHDADYLVNGMYL